MRTLVKYRICWKKTFHLDFLGTEGYAVLQFSAPTVDSYFWRLIHSHSTLFFNVFKDF